MQTKKRISVSLPQNLTNFVQSSSRAQQITQSAVIEKALGILKKLQEQQALKNAYLGDNENNLDEFVEVFFNDCLNHEN